MSAARAVMRSDHSRPQQASITPMTSSQPPTPPDSRKLTGSAPMSWPRPTPSSGRPGQHRRGGACAGHPGVDPGREAFALNDVALRGLHQRRDRQAVVLGELPTHREPLPMRGQRRSTGHAAQARGDVGAQPRPRRHRPQATPPPGRRPQRRRRSNAATGCAPTRSSPTRTSNAPCSAADSAARRPAPGDRRLLRVHSVTPTIDARRDGTDRQHDRQCAASDDARARAHTGNRRRGGARTPSASSRWRDASRATISSATASASAAALTADPGCVADVVKRLAPQPNPVSDVPCGDHPDPAVIAALEHRDLARAGARRLGRGRRAAPPARPRRAGCAARRGRARRARQAPRGEPAPRRGCWRAPCPAPPSWPVLSAASRSTTSAPRTSPTTIRSGRIRSACLTRSRTVTSPTPSTLAHRATSLTRCGCAGASSAASSTQTMRSSAGNGAQTRRQQRRLARAGAAGDEERQPRAR